MLDKLYRNFLKKSLKERFLLVLGFLFFVLYFVLGLFVIFMDDFPLKMETSYRIAFGILLIIYASIRFVRIIKYNKD